MLQITHQTSQQPQGLRHTWCSTLTWPNTVLRQNLHQQLLFSGDSWISSVRTSRSSPRSSCRLQWRRSFWRVLRYFGRRGSQHDTRGQVSSGKPAAQCGVQRAKDSLPTPIHPETGPLESLRQLWCHMLFHFTHLWHISGASAHCWTIQLFSACTSHYIIFNMEIHKFDLFCWYWLHVTPNSTQVPIQCF